MIDDFDGAYAFLSNFYRSAVTLDGRSYSTVEHAYQAAKTLDPIAREIVRACPTAAAAKKAGRKLDLRPDWEQVKLDVMRGLLREKFATDPLKSALIATGSDELVEGNWWGDTYWGRCRGVGENHLGRLLMGVRAELKAAR